MELAQIAALFHDRCDPFGRRVGRAVIDVDDFVSPSAIKRRSDLCDQWRHILGFVTHGYNDGNGHDSVVGGNQ